MKRLAREHTFGGVVFEETGEEPRQLGVGEWGILVDTGSAVCGTKELYSSYIPLRPVRLDTSE